MRCSEPESSQPSSGAGDRGDPRRDRLATVAAAPGRVGAGGRAGRRATAPARGPRPTPPRPRGTGSRDERRTRSSSRPSARTLGLGPVAVHQRCARPRARSPVAAGEPGRHRVQAGAGRRADDRQLGRRARPARALVAEHGIDRVAGHDPVGRVLAAAHPHQAGRLDADPVLARDPDRRRGPDGAISGRSPAYVPTTSSRVSRRSRAPLSVPRISSTSSSLAADRSTGPAVRLVGRADDPVARPRDEERDAAGDPERHAAAGRDPVARDDEVAPRGAAPRTSPRRTADRAARPRRRSRRARPSARMSKVAPDEAVLDRRARDAAAVRAAAPWRGPASRRPRRRHRARAPSATTASANRASSSIASW